MPPLPGGLEAVVAGRLLLMLVVMVLGVRQSVSCPRVFVPTVKYSTVQYSTSHVSLEVFNSNIKIESMRARLETSAWPPDTNI